MARTKESKRSTIKQPPKSAIPKEKSTEFTVKKSTNAYTPGVVSVQALKRHREATDVSWKNAKAE
jgi:ribosomal protein L7/L12